MMLHLVYNYPNPKAFEQILEIIYTFNPKYLEIQLPFSNPSADGQLIKNANIAALEYFETLEEMLSTVQKIKNRTKATTNNVVMSYLAPISFLGIEKSLHLIEKFNFYGTIIPDLPLNCEEIELFQKSKITNIPVITLNTSKSRLLEYKPKLGQPIYVMARKGITGSKTELNLETLSDFRKEFSEYEVCLGFGICENSQVVQLQNLDIVPIIGSQILKLINNSTDLKSDLTNLLK